MSEALQVERTGSLLFVGIFLLPPGVNITYYDRKQKALQF
jgi:hypothetical protein